jgi:Fur family ferric uptake transcriptional regulator
MHFDGDVRDHYHVRCVHCGRIGDVPVKAADRIEAASRGAGGYEIVGHRLEFVGICPSCGKRKRVRESAGKGRR